MTLSKRSKSLATVSHFLTISILPWSSSRVIMPVVLARYRMFRTKSRRVHKWSKGSEVKKTFKRCPAVMCGFWVRFPVRRRHLVMSGSLVTSPTCGMWLCTVEPLIGHTPRWIARAMGYERLWVLRGQFGCKFQIGRCRGLWLTGGMGYVIFDCRT